MDTVQEENIRESDQLLHPAEIALQNTDNLVQNRPHDSADGVFHEHSTLSSRRPSAIIAALRRPSQAFALSTAHVVMNHRQYLLSVFEGQNDRSVLIDGGSDDKAREEKLKNRKLGDDALTTILSALYAKLMVVLGMAFPITETISSDVRPFYYQGFYLYLYLGSILFVVYMYATLMREKVVFSILNSYHKNFRSSKATAMPDKNNSPPHGQHHQIQRYGSLYLRLGAIAFGIGSMVYSGLEFGRYFELKNDLNCNANILQAITPATRMLLTLVQVQFIFLNNKHIELNRHKIIARFGLMHMIATNICEWLYVLVEETKHEIMHLEEHSTNESDSQHPKYCQEGRVMGSLITKASPFLFPCTIEYSLICAVILYEMWKKVKVVNIKFDGKVSNRSRKTSQNQQETFPSHHVGNMLLHKKSHHHISVDCSNAHRGLLAGILVIVLTIISLIMFFVLNNENSTIELKHLYKSHAEFEVNIFELLLHVISTISILIAMYQMRVLKYDRKIGAEGVGIGLDNTLLVVAQTGMFIYCMFSIIGCYFTLSSNSPAGLLAEIFSFIQTCLQTMFVLDGWWRRCRNLEQTKRKPGRELVTFLIITNMAMWTINTMEKNRAEFRPSHLEFFGDWAWTIITHISMPLAIFYRFHSTICLFEIWKSAYKIKTPYSKHYLLPYH